MIFHFIFIWGSAINFGFGCFSHMGYQRRMCSDLKPDTRIPKTVSHSLAHWVPPSSAVQLSPSIAQKT